MENSINHQEMLIRGQQQEQQRQRLQQQQQLQHDPSLVYQRYGQPSLSSSSTFPPSFSQQHHPSVPSTPRQQHQYLQGPFMTSSSSSPTFAGSNSEHQFMSSSTRRNSTLVEPQQQQYQTGVDRGGRLVAQDQAAQEPEALTMHRQQFQQHQQQLLQQQQAQTTTTSAPATPLHTASRPLQNQGQGQGQISWSGVPYWLQRQQQVQYQQQLQHQQLIQQEQQQEQHQPRRSPRRSVGMSSTPYLASSQETVGATPRSSVSMLGRYSSAGPASTSFSYPRTGPIGMGRVSPYAPPLVTTRNQDQQYNRRASATIDVDALPNLNPNPNVGRRQTNQYLQEQQQQQHQRIMPPPLITTSQPFTARAAAPATLATRPTPPPPPVYGLGGGSGSGGDGYGFDTACPQEPGAVETVLPAQAPILIHGPGSMGDDGAPGGDLEMDYILEEEERGPPPIEVTLNIDIPKSSRPPAEGTPSTTVLNVNPSWHVVFVETVQRQRIRTSIRIQFCPSSTTARLVEHRAKIRRLQTVQVIAYASRRVELSRRIQGQSLLNKGGFILHLDPSSITFNEASYGFTLSLSSFEIEQLSRARHSRPDTPLPLARQQNSAYCRRNLKEMYYDTVSKDVTITLRPSGDIFYAHSVVLESHAYFRALVEQQQQLRSSVAGVVVGGIGDDGEDGDGGGGMVVETEAVVDEEGYAQPLRPQQQQRPSSSSSFQGSSRYLAGGDGFLGTGGGDGSQDRTRARIAIEMNDTSPTVFRAVLHYMYMGHVPVTGVFSTQEPPQQQPQQPVGPSAATAGQGSASGGAVQDGASISAHQGGSSSSGMSGMDALTEAATIAATESSGVGAPFSSTAGLPASALPISADSPMGPPPPPSSPIEATTTAPATAASANVNATSTTHLPPAPVAAPMPSPAPAPAQATTIVGEFPWRDVYEIASRYQLSGLMHLSKVALLSRLDVERAVRELFEWSYHHWSLVPAYVSFLIERVDATVLSGPSLLWPYHDVCPVYDEIMLIFLQKLNERKETSTLI